METAILERNLATYGTENPEALMDKFYQAGNEMLLNLRNLVTNPQNRKKPRTWGAIEAAKMVNISNPTFRKLLEKYKDISGVISEKKRKWQNNK